MIDNNTVISEDQVDDFIAEAKKTFKTASAINIEEVTLHYRVDIATTDKAGGADSPAEVKVFQRAAAAADRSSINCRTQDPIIDGSASLPGDMLIGIFGIAAVVEAGQASAAADTADLLSITQSMMATILRLQTGALRRFELRGHEYLSLGVGERVEVENANETNWGVMDRSIRKLKPVVFGKDQQPTLSLFIGRTTDWPQAFSVDISMPALIGRVK